MESELATAQRLAIVVLNLAVASAFGAGAATFWLRRAGSAWAGGTLRRLRKAMLAAVVAAIPAYLAVLWLEAASMAELPVAQAWGAVRSVLAATHYGFAWLLGAGALAIAGLTLALVRGARGAVPGLGALALFLYSRSIVSHAGAAGDVTFAVAVDWLHLVLASLWVGAVIVAGLVVARGQAAAGADSRADCALYVQALSNAATLALAGLFVTGLLGAWRGLGSFRNAFGNPYAGTLLVKVALVLAAAALGGANRFLVMPGLLARLRDRHGQGAAQQAAQEAGQAGAPDRRFARILQVEAAILVAVMIAAAILSSTSPPTAS